MKEFVLNEILTPNEDDFRCNTIKIDKSVIESPMNNGVVYAGRKAQYLDDNLTVLKIWDGEIHRDYTRKEPISKFMNAIKEYKAHIKNLKRN